MKSYSHACGGFDRAIVVGDIHGCHAEFQELCHLVNFGARDALVTVGDFLDRGLDSWKVAAFFRDSPNAFSVLGNHERRVAGTIRGTSKPAWSQEQTLSLLPKEDWDHWACYLEQLPAVFETDHVLITHARLDPTRPIMEQDPYCTAGVGGDTVRIELDSNGVPLGLVVFLIFFEWKVFRSRPVMFFSGSERVSGQEPAQKTLIQPDTHLHFIFLNVSRKSHKKPASRQ